MDTIEIVNTSLNNSTGNGTFMPLPKPDRAIGLANQILVTSSLVFVMLGMGCTITLKGLWKYIRRPYGVTIGAACQFILMPLAGFGFAHALQLESPQALGTLIISCCPGGTLSNLFCYYSDGDVTLSILMTTCSTVLAIGMMPLNLFIYSRSWTNESTVVPYTDIVLALVSILVPAAVGMLIRWKSEKVANITQKVCSAIAMTIIVASLTLQVATNATLFIATWKPWFLATFLPMFGFMLGYITSIIFRLDEAKRRTVGFETGCQNVALALTVINLSFPPGLAVFQMMVIPSLFGICMILDSLLFLIAFQLYTRVKKRRASAGDETDKVDEQTRDGEPESGRKTSIPTFSLNGDVTVTGEMPYSTYEDDNDNRPNFKRTAYLAPGKENYANGFHDPNAREISTQTFEEEGADGMWDIIEPRKWKQLCDDHETIVRAGQPGLVYADGIPNYGAEVDGVAMATPVRRGGSNTNTPSYTNYAFQQDIDLSRTPYLLGDGRVVWESSI